MKNPVNLETMWAAESAKQTKNLVAAQAKLAKSNRAAFAAWVSTNQVAWNNQPQPKPTNPAAALAAAA